METAQRDFLQKQHAPDKTQTQIETSGARVGGARAGGASGGRVAFGVAAARAGPCSHQNRTQNKRA